MINVILGSTIKELLLVLRNLVAQVVHLSSTWIQSGSPTYTPVENPAEDLSEFCDKISNFAKWIDRRMNNYIRRIKFSKWTWDSDAGNNRCQTKKDRQIITDTRRKLNSCRLKRQWTVRRKYLKNEYWQQLQQKNKSDHDDSGVHSVGNEMESEQPQIVSLKTPSDIYFSMSSFLKNTTGELCNIRHTSQQHQRLKYYTCTAVILL